MEIKNVKRALITQMNLNLSGNLYHKTQIEFAYHNNRIEGSSIAKDETTSIYDTDTIIINSEKVLVIKDVIETKNHFTLFKYMLETIDDDLSEELIKQYHLILKNGTLTEDEKKWFQVGEYKTLKNFVGDITTSLPNNVSKDMKELLSW